MHILSNFQGPRTILRRGRLIYECFSNAFLLKKTSKFRVFTKKHDWICYFLPKYAWENCSWAFSCLDQNSNLNLSPAGWPGKFFFSPFPRKWLETISRNDLKWCIMAFPEKTFRKVAHNIRKYAKKVWDDSDKNSWGTLVTTVSVLPKIPTENPYFQSLGKQCSQEREGTCSRLSEKLLTVSESMHKKFGMIPTRIHGAP